MNRSNPWLKSEAWQAALTGDTGLSIGFFVLGVLSRLPFRSKLLYHWDSVNFALGMEHFDVRLHQPHAPGYLLYILLGRLVNVLTGDANASLVWISVFFGGLTVSIVYWLGRRLFTRTEAVIAALLTLTSPAFWFYGGVALTYIVEAFFVTAVVLACFETLRGRAHLVWLSALLLGLAGGVRQTTLVLMLPLWIFSLRRCHWGLRLLGGVLLVSTIAAWGVPSIILSGGLSSYLEASRSIGSGVLTNLEIWGRGLDVVGPFVRLGMYLIYGLMLGFIPLLYMVIKGAVHARAQLRYGLLDDRFHVMALWLVPNLILYAPLVRAPGHTFSFMPALVLLTAAALGMVGRDLAARFSQPAARMTFAWTALVVLVNAAFFLAAPPFLFNTRRIITTTPSWPTIRYRDEYLAERVAYLQRHFDPATTLILTAGPDYRHPDYYLRGYPTLSYGQGVLISRVPPESRSLVFFTGNLTTHQSSVRSVTLPSGEQLLSLPLQAKSEVIVRDYEVFVQSENARDSAPAWFDW